MHAIIVLPALLAPSLVESAFAGPTVSVPAPIIGAGLPGLAVLGGVYGVILLRRKKRSDPKPV